MTVSDIIVPVAASVASVLTSGGAFVAWLNRKTKKDRELDQEQHDTEIEQLKISVTTDVVVLLRDELTRAGKVIADKDDKLEYQDRLIGWLRRKVVRLEDWAETVRRENPTIAIPVLPPADSDPPPTMRNRNAS